MTMRMLVGLAVLLCARAGAEEAGKRSELFETWQAAGQLREERRVEKETYTLVLWTHRGQFDVSGAIREKMIDPAALFDQVLSVYDWVVPHSIEALGGPVRDVHVVLVDGYEKESTSAALRGTNVILNEIRRWHERLGASESRREILYGSAAHEFFHLQNYRTDPDESKFGREFHAMVWESSILVRRNGGPGLWGMIRSLKARAVAEGTALDGDFAATYDAVRTRGLAFHVANLLLRKGGVEAIEAVAKALLHDEGDGVASLDAALAARGGDLTYGSALEGYRAFVRKAGAGE